MATNLEKMNPNAQLIYDSDTGALIGIKNPHGNGLDFSFGVKTDGTGAIRSFSSNGTPLLMSLANPRRRAVFLGDSLTWGGANGRASGFFDGRIWYQLSTPVTTNLGGGNWLVQCMVEGTAGTAGGTLQTDGRGNLQWKYSTDSYGPLVNVSQGGFFYLTSGTLANSGIFVTVRGATAAPTVAGTGAVTTAGLPTIADYNLLGYVAWVAGALGETFSDYQSYGISGCNTADVLKFTPQALATDVEAVFILIGVNDIPATSAAAAVTVANIKAIIDLSAAKARRVYVNEIFPWPLGSQTQQKFLSLVSNAIRLYCRTKSNVRFCTAYDKMFAPNASTISSYTDARSGVFNTDSLHLMPYGAWVAARPVVAAVLQDYQLEPVRRAVLDVWDSTLQTGSLNLNPSLRGTAGSPQGSAGITGTVPDSYLLTRSGTTQTCTTSFDAATDGGIDWWSMSVAGATSGDYHMLRQSITLPAGVAVGDYIRISVEMQVFSTTSPGLSTLQVQANSNSNIQSAYPFQVTVGRNVNTFTTELPTNRWFSEPMKLLPGVTGFDLIIRVGADATGGTGAGKVGFRELRMEKVAGPIYP